MPSLVVARGLAAGRPGVTGLAPGAVLLDRPLPDLRVVRQQTFGDRMRQGQRSERASDRLELVVGDVLVAEEDHAPLHQGRPDLLRRCGVQRLGKIDAREFGSNRRRDWLHDQPGGLRRGPMTGSIGFEDREAHELAPWSGGDVTATLIHDYPYLSNVICQRGGQAGLR